ncbi:unnamed protein product [Fraxinus pennsylvanica]|uniref:Wall-associated receptor kinase galacturonan-binding domain-containing protein n=1 Tax=Fraxinus pennsylvanica TaxID=56036 RepID=A0AAD1ZC93_9LAMI|nr:unnamed protein product [Fraxinus pennsylvanica]
MATRCALLHMFFLLSLAVAHPSNSTNNTKPGCQSCCGNVEIPYPFGIGPNCFMNSNFSITCNTSSNPPKPYLSFDGVSLEEEVSYVELHRPSLHCRLKCPKRSVQGTLTPAELKTWVKDLPAISHRLTYSKILDLKRKNKLKHVIKQPNAEWRQRPEVVLAVLEDNNVVRIVLPSIETKALSKKALELKRVREEFKWTKNEELEKLEEERKTMEKSIKMQKKMEEKKKRQEIKKDQV